MGDRLRLQAGLVVAAVAVGLAAALPWVAFARIPVVQPLGLQPGFCEFGDWGCAVEEPSWLVTMALIAIAGAGYGTAAVIRTGQGRRPFGALAGGGSLVAVALAGYSAVADNPALQLIHGRLGVALDELTPWVGIAEAFGITVFVASFIVVLASALAARARWSLMVAGTAALCAAGAFVGIVVLVDPVLGIRLGAESVGTFAMPWTGLVGNLAAGIAGGLVGLWLMRPRPPLDP